MKKLAAVCLLFAAAACSSSRDAELDNAPSYVPPAQTAAPAAPDPRVAELQTTMTELLERLDVLNDRIAKLEAQPVAAAAAPPAAAPASAAPPRSQPAPAASAALAAASAAPAPSQPALVSAKIADDYRNAILLYGRNRIADSRRAFQAVFDADPTGDLADNALFWIGESYFAAGDYANAMRFYKRVIDDFGDQNKAPDAMYKTAIALEKTGDLALARKTLQEVIARYPYSTPAAGAKHELERIRF